MWPLAIDFNQLEDLFLGRTIPLPAMDHDNESHVDSCVVEKMWIIIGVLVAPRLRIIFLVYDCAALVQRNIFSALLTKFHSAAK